VRLGRALLIGALSELVLLAVGFIVAFATDWTGIGPWLAAPILGMVAALIDFLAQSRADVRAARSAEVTSSLAPAPPVVPRPRPRTPLAVGLLITLVLMGGGGWALAAGAGYVAGIVTGNEPGVDRLASAPIVADNKGVVATVDGVEHTAHFTRVTIVIRNGLSSALSLPLSSNCALSDAGGTTLDVDAFRSSWSPSIAPGESRRGVLVFAGGFTDSPVTVSLTCANVFVQGFEGPASLEVPGIELAELGA